MFIDDFSYIFRIQYLGADDIIRKTEEDIKDLTTKSCGVKLQLIVVCPSFLEFISLHPEECAILGKILLADRTLALLLGVNDEDLIEVHKNGTRLFS